MCEFQSGSENGRQSFHRLLINLWDEKNPSNPTALRRFEEYESPEQAIWKLEEVERDESFDEWSRLKAALLAQDLRRLQQTGKTMPRSLLSRRISQLRQQMSASRYRGHGES